MLRRSYKLANDPRIKIITGHFGSGKTEIAINLSFLEREKHEKVAIADLDVINPYFRSREVNSFYEEKGIELIAPKGKLATSDLPIVSGEIHRVLHDPNYHLIIDVGGDKDGATALGQYYNELKNLEHELYFVINVNRPYVSTVQGIKDTIKRIEKVARLKVSGLINNTHLGIETTLEDVEKGYEVALETSEELNLPILYTTISNHLVVEAQEFAKTHQVIFIQRFMKLPWE